MAQSLSIGFHYNTFEFVCNHLNFADVYFMSCRGSFQSLRYTLKHKLSIQDIWTNEADKFSIISFTIEMQKQKKTFFGLFMLCIFTSQWVLHMPFAGRNHTFPKSQSAFGCIH